MPREWGQHKQLSRVWVRVVEVTRASPRGFTIHLSCGHSYWREKKAWVLPNTYCPSCPLQWSREHRACVVCGLGKRRHIHDGICERCYITAKYPPGDWSDSSPNRINSVDDHVLDCWTEQAAYFLGVMRSDGHLKLRQKHGDKYYPAREMVIGVKAGDIAWLQDLARLVSYNGPIYEYEGQSGDGIYHKAAGLHFSSKRVARRLVEMGYFDKDAAQVPNSVFPHFVRGFFDGDGSVFKSRRDNHVYLQTSFAAASDILESIRDRLGALIGTSTAMRLVPKTNSLACFSLQYGAGDTKKLYVAMYEGATICLQRKRARFQEFYEVEGDGIKEVKQMKTEERQARLQRIAGIASEIAGVIITAEIVKAVDDARREEYNDRLDERLRVAVRGQKEAKP